MTHCTNINPQCVKFTLIRLRPTFLKSLNYLGETPASSAEENYCRLALDMPRIVNTYVHF
jgi:hypothetical protein